MFFWKRESYEPPKLVATSPIFAEVDDVVLFVGIDTASRLWFVSIKKTDSKHFHANRLDLCTIHTFYPILDIDKTVSGDIILSIVESPNHTDLNAQYHDCIVQSLISGRILTKYLTQRRVGIYNPNSNPQRLFVKQNHPQFDLLESLFPKGSLQQTVEPPRQTTDSFDWFMKK
jgi:hypothetical protein